MNAAVHRSGRPRRAASEHGYKREDTSPSPPPAAPKSRGRSARVLHRKTDHSVIERRRREKINDRLVCLQHTVPACREKAWDVLKRKPGPGGIAPSDEQLEKRLHSDMVLEKLCIIAHTVDYVYELREQLEAYRKMCNCSPPVSPTLEPRECDACSAEHDVASSSSVKDTPSDESDEPRKPSVDQADPESDSDVPPSPEHPAEEAMPVHVCPHTPVASWSVPHVHAHPHAPPHAPPVRAAVPHAHFHHFLHCRHPPMHYHPYAPHAPYAWPPAEDTCYDEAHGHVCQPRYMPSETWDKAHRRQWAMAHRSSGYRRLAPLARTGAARPHDCKAMARDDLKAGVAPDAPKRTSHAPAAPVREAPPREALMR